MAESVTLTWGEADLNGHPPVRPEPEPTTHDVQAAADGVAGGDTVEFMGQSFRLAERVNFMALLKFAKAGKTGLDSAEMDGMAAMYDLIRSVIHRPVLLDKDGRRQHDPDTGRLIRDESEWTRFEELADDEEADSEQVMEVVNQAMEKIAARPTPPPGASSASSRRTSGSSKASSSLPAMPPELAGMTPVADLAR